MRTHAIPHSPGLKLRLILSSDRSETAIRKQEALDVWKVQQVSRTDELNWALIRNGNAIGLFVSQNSVELVQAALMLGQIAEERVHELEWSAAAAIRTDRAPFAGKGARARVEVRKGARRGPTTGRMRRPTSP